MTAFLRRDLRCLFLRNYFSYLRKSRVSFPSSLQQFYSTSTKKPVINPTVSDFLLHRHHFSPAAAAEVASVRTRLRNPEKSDSLLSFLKENEFSNTHLEKILKYCPSFISADLEKSVKPKIRIFQELGFSNNDIADLFASNASILFRSATGSVIPALCVLKRVMGSDVNIVKLLMKSGWFSVRDLEKCMVPNIEFLKGRCVPMQQIVKGLHSFPRLFLQKPEHVRKHADKAEEMGARPNTKLYFQAVRVIGSHSDEAWELKLQAFRDSGFSEDDILNAFKKNPQVFGVSGKKMVEVKELLVSCGKYDVASIISCSLSFAISIEKRFKPRLQVLAALERKNLINKWPSLSTLCKVTDEYFFGRFVGPYVDEVGHLFVAKTTASARRKAKLLPITLFWHFITENYL